MSKVKKLVQAVKKTTRSVTPIVRGIVGPGKSGMRRIQADTLRSYRNDPSNNAALRKRVKKFISQ